jgi:hypothetical protein
MMNVFSATLSHWLQNYSFTIAFLIFNIQFNLIFHKMFRLSCLTKENAMGIIYKTLLFHVGAFIICHHLLIYLLYSIYSDTSYVFFIILYFYIHSI